MHKNLEKMKENANEIADYAPSKKHKNTKTTEQFHTDFGVTDV